METSKARIMTDVINPILETLAGTEGRDVDNVLPARIVSADSHVTEPPGTYLDRIDPVEIGARRLGHMAVGGNDPRRQDIIDIAAFGAGQGLKNRIDDVGHDARL